MSRARDLADSYTDSEIDSDVINAKAGRKNLIINGGFDVWQRGASFTDTVNLTRYTADRFVILNGGANGTLIRRTLVPAKKGFKYSAQYSGTASDPFFQQVIEGSQAVAGREATFSFWINGTLSDLAVPPGYIGDGTYTSISSLGASLIETVGTWNRYSVTHTFATGDYNPIVRLDFAEDTATTIQTTGWQLELGSQATDFEYRSYGEELALCQRYYRPIFIQSYRCVGLVRGEPTAGQYTGEVRYFSPAMRANPTANTISVNTQISSDGATTLDNTTSISAQAFSDRFSLFFSGGSAASNGLIRNTDTSAANLTITLDAEL